MATDSNNPAWLEAPPPQKPRKGCAGQGCVFLILFAILTAVLIGLGSYLLYSGGSKPMKLPVEQLPSAQLADVQQRVDQFKSAPTTPSYTPAPTATPEAGAEATPEPPAPTPDTERKLTLSGSDINGLISANPKSRGHAYVSVSGNSATVQVSIPSDKVPALPKGYLNGSFVITTDGPTPISALQVSKIQANGFPVPSGILTMSVGGKSIMGYAMEGAAPYNVTTAEIRDGVVILR